MMIVDYLRTQLKYVPETGELLWLVEAKNRPLGMNVGERRTFLIEQILFVRAKVCWALHYGEYPKETIDHKDTNFKNDRIINLRKAIGSQNQYNKAVKNPSGHKGVTWRNRIKKPWLSKIRVNGRRINLGSFATKEEAAEAYRIACAKYHGEFANLGVK